MQQTLNDPTALAELDHDDFTALISKSLNRNADPALWDALTSPRLITRTKNTLGSLRVDIQNQLSDANAELDKTKAECLTLGEEGKARYYQAKADQSEWRNRVRRLNRLLDQRLALVKSRIERPAEPAPGTGRARYTGALETLARAVAQHRRIVLSDKGGPEDDEALWQQLQTVTVPDGDGRDQSLAEWLAYLDDARDPDQP